MMVGDGDPFSKPELRVFPREGRPGLGVSSGFPWSDSFLNRFLHIHLRQAVFGGLASMDIAVLLPCGKASWQGASMT